MTETTYILDATSLQDKIKRLDTIITALELRMIDNAENLNIEEYRINDGQIQIQTEYQDLDQISKAILMYERLKEKYINQLNGRGMILRPWQGLY